MSVDVNNSLHPSGGIFPTTGFLLLAYMRYFIKTELKMCDEHRLRNPPDPTQDHSLPGYWEVHSHYMVPGIEDLRILLSN